ncbi:MAG: hypothetical protein ACRC8M_13810 [Cetobacterium sp.]|uniref:hypothetical protein n=1 Tax=Cetobacterium sp. TaxID=2071632 RepID=UPI003F36D04A
MEYLCKECGSDSIELENTNPFESKYICQECGNNSKKIECIAESTDNYLGKEVKFKNSSGEIGEGKVIGILSDKACIVIEIDGLYKKDRISGWHGECLKEENVHYLKNYKIREDKGYYYIKIYEIFEVR